MSDAFSYSPARSLPAKITRRLTQWRTAAPLGLPPKKTIVSFTFDDFPISAGTHGSDILEKYGAKGTYYTSTGLKGKDLPTGKQFENEDIRRLMKNGHEIAAHTHTHLDCAAHDIQTVLSDIDRNVTELNDLTGREMTQFAYPYGETTAALKQELTSKFSIARGILPGINTEKSDRMQLRALELTPDPYTTKRALSAIETGECSPSWIVIFTHDVADEPSNYGAKKSALNTIAKAAKDSGAELLTMSEAYSTISA